MSVPLRGASLDPRPTSGAGHRRQYRRRGVGALAALLAPLLVVSPGAADEIAQKRAEAARLAEALEAQGRQVSLLAEELNEARLNAERTAGQVSAIKGQVRETDQLVRQATARVKGHAVASYLRGGQMPVEHFLSIRSVDELAVRRIYVTAVVGNEQAVIGALQNARELRDARLAQLEAAQLSARSELSAVEARRQAAARAAAEEEATLGRVRGDLATLVAAENRRRAEDEDRRGRVEAARRDQLAARPLPLRSAPAVALGPIGAVGAPAAGAAAAVAEAKRQIGKPYRWGAEGPDSFDCSGLTLWAWRAGGKSLPHSSRAQYSATSRVPVSAIQPGDLTFYGSPIHHMGIYVGNGQMVEASQTGTPVRYASIYRRDLVGVGRVS